MFTQLNFDLIYSKLLFTDMERIFLANCSNDPIDDYAEDVGPGVS